MIDREPMTGEDLIAAREAVDVTPAAVGRQMKVSRQYIRILENSRVLTGDAAPKYLKALDELVEEAKEGATTQ